MADNNVTVFPPKGDAYRLRFAMWGIDGLLVTDWTGISATVSKDQGNYAACDNDPIQIQTSGTGYLDLTAAEMNAKDVLVIVTLSGAVDVIRDIVTDGLVEIASVVDTESDFTIPVWDPSVEITTFHELQAFLRALTYYAGQLDGNIGKICNTSGTVVATYSFNGQDIQGFRTKPAAV